MDVHKYHHADCSSALSHNSIVGIWDKHDYQLHPSEQLTISTRCSILLTRLKNIPLEEFSIAYCSKPLLRCSRFWCLHHTGRVPMGGVAEAPLRSIRRQEPGSRPAAILPSVLGRFTICSSVTLVMFRKGLQRSDALLR